MRIAAIMLGTLLALSSYSSAQTIDPALAAREKEFAAATKGKNVQTILAFFTDDAVSYGDGMRFVKGRPVLQIYWERVVQRGSMDAMTDKVVDAQTSGDLGYIHGTFAFPPLNGMPARTGNFLHVWKKVGNQWLIAYDTFSDDPTPQPNEIRR